MSDDNNSDEQWPLADSDDQLHGVDYCIDVDTNDLDHRIPAIMTGSRV